MPGQENYEFKPWFLDGGGGARTSQAALRPVRRRPLPRDRVGSRVDAPSQAKAVAAGAFDYAPAPEIPISEHLPIEPPWAWFSLVGGNIIARGEHFLPLHTGGKSLHQYRAFSIIDFRNGQRIF
jgi:hypothetical protein